MKAYIEANYALLYILVSVLVNGLLLFLFLATTQQDPLIAPRLGLWFMAGVIGEAGSMVTTILLIKSRAPRIEK